HEQRTNNAFLSSFFKEKFRAHNRTNQNTKFPHRSNITDWGKSHHSKHKNISSRTEHSYTYSIFASPFPFLSDVPSLTKHHRREYNRLSKYNQIKINDW